MRTKGPSLRDFQNRFPTEESCLDHLFQVRYAGTNCPKCDRPVSYSRVKGRRAFQCAWCANQLYPTAGTPFDRTRTSLRDWFYVMFLFTTTRNGVAAKRVERELGVTYKTAWRMCHEVRKYMASLDGSEPVGGPGEVVEIDESYIGGRRQGRGNYRDGKTLVMGFLERDGDLMTTIVPDNRKHTLLPQITANVLPGSIVHTDELMTYRNIPHMGFQHHTTNHSRKQYVGPTGGHVQTLEGFWNILKRGINGTHIHVSSKHLPKYLGEFEFRWNMRAVPHLMLDRLLHSFVA